MSYVVNTSNISQGLDQALTLAIIYDVVMASDCHCRQLFWMLKRVFLEHLNA